MKKDKQIDIKDPILYSGSVIIYNYKTDGSVEIIRNHNAGEVGLFDCVTRALAGQNIRNYIPTKISGFDNSASEQELFKDIGTSTNVVRGKINNNGDWTEVSGDTVSDSIQLTFLIAKSDFTGNGDKIYKLKLYNTNNSLCAEMDLSDNPLSLNASNNIVIYWRLHFSNVN